jgi:hypothetical protein
VPIATLENSTAAKPQAVIVTQSGRLICTCDIDAPPQEKQHKRNKTGNFS